MTLTLRHGKPTNDVFCRYFAPAGQVLIITKEFNKKAALQYSKTAFY
jgi:hypothetical protein